MIKLMAIGLSCIFLVVNSAVPQSIKEQISIERSSGAQIGASAKREEKGLTKEKKMQVLAYINGILDPLSDTNISDAKLEEKANKVWKEAENKFNITESDIFSIMGDMNLMKEYYSNSYVDPVTDYQATLENNGYGTVVIAVSKEAMDEYTRALVSKEQFTLDSLVQAGQISYETNGTRVNIIDAGLATTKVKLLEGLNEGATVFVISEQVEMK